MSGSVNQQISILHYRLSRRTFTASLGLMAVGATVLGIGSPAVAASYNQEGPNELTDKVFLVCNGASPNPKYTYLDGRTGNGTVGLAPTTEPPYSGTLWLRTRFKGGQVTFKCLGDKPNPKYAYLDGRTDDGTVGLAPEDYTNYSGTLWAEISIESGLYVVLKCLGNKPNPKYVYLDGRTGDGTVGLAPNYTNYSGARWGINRVS